MWHRLSVHVKRQEAGSNQMAVIKPLTNTYHNTALEFSDLSTKTLYNVAEEDENDPIRYNPPTPPMMAHGQMPAGGPMKEVDEDEVEFYTPERLQQNSLIQQHMITPFQGVGGQYNSDVPQLSDMIRLPDSMVGGGRPVYHQPHLIQQHQVLPLEMDPFDEEPISIMDEEEEEEELEEEQFGLLHGYMYDNAQIHDEEELVQVKLAMENSLSLMPPSPFRDSMGTGNPFPNSPGSESILCTPQSVTYASVILRDYKQTSSTL